MIDAITATSQADPQTKQANNASLPQSIANALHTAAARTGVDFAYLVNKASQESSFNPDAKASTSSAAGLYQFTGQTWLQMVKAHGAAYGLGNYADQITIDTNGVAHAANPAMRQAILNLRQDPTISAEMAGELDKANLSSLKTNVGGKLGATDLYLAHFLGAGGASDFIKAMRSNPNVSAADVVPDAAASNANVFYGASGQPKTLGQIYQHFAQKFDAAPAHVMVASAAPVQNTTISTPLPTQDTSSYTALANAIYASAPAPSSYAPIGTSDLKTGSGSVYAAMAIAQTTLDHINSLSAYEAMNRAYGGKKNAADTSNGLA